MIRQLDINEIKEINGGKHKEFSICEEIPTHSHCSSANGHGSSGDAGEFIPTLDEVEE